ncbi:MAG: DNA repair protein RecN [Methylacidiphilales bacterium]|nr:DNA repair protein RecN [Candidatus Methylacidiphilales bacterium]
MLVELNVKNFILAKDITLTFDRGLTVITGETGAGKSILIDALQLILGGRAHVSTIRNGEQRADIQAWFEIENNNQIIALLHSYNIPLEDKNCIISRSIFSDGKSKASINGITVTNSILKLITNLLVEIHGQNQHIAFTESSFQRSFIDEYGSITELRKEYEQLFDQHALQIEHLNQLNNDHKVSNEKKEYIEYLCDELNQLHLKPKEWEELTKKQLAIANRGEITSTLTLLQSIFIDDQKSITNQLKTAMRAASSSKLFKNQFPTILDLMEIVNQNIADVADDLRMRLEEFDNFDEPIELVEQRMSAIHKIARKLHVEPEQLLQTQDKLLQELNNVTRQEETIHELTLVISSLHNKMIEKAKAISLKRIATCQELSKAVSIVLPDVALQNTTFTIDCKQHHDTLQKYGIDLVSFNASFNLGSVVQPLDKIASGGELSRIALALYLASITSNIKTYNTHGTLFFDEIDTGIGGETATSIGKLLAKLARQHQVFVITHHAIIAAQAETQITIEKSISENSTETIAKVVSDQERIAELSRMLSGSSIAKASIENAKELLKNAKSGKIKK